MQNKDDRTHLVFNIAARGLTGLQNNLMTVTEGEAVMAHRFTGFGPWRGEIGGRRNGSLIALEAGTAIAYSINRLQDRGTFFIHPNEKVYAGQVIGQNSRQDDLVVNVIHTKKLSNVRAAGADEKLGIAPPVKFSLEEAMEYIAEDEYIEVTPQSLRLRKILLNEHERKRADKSGMQLE